MVFLISKIILIFLKIDQNFFSFTKCLFKKGKNPIQKEKKSKNILKEVKKKENLKNSTLVNPPPHLSHALSSMHHDVCMQEINREGRKNYLKGVVPVAVLLVSWNAAQSNLHGVQRNPPETSIIQPTKMMYMNDFY